MKDLLNFLRVSIVGHFRSYAILLKQESEPVSGVAAPTGGSEEVYCNYCSQTVSAETKTCPHCGGTSFTITDDLGKKEWRERYYRMKETAQGLERQLEQIRKDEKLIRTAYTILFDEAKQLEGEMAALKAVAEKANAELKTIRSKGVTSSISEYERLDKLVTEITAALGEKTN